MIYKQSILSAAITQSFGYLVSLSDEQTGARWTAALFKAKDEILENGTIRFDRHNRVLRFVSRYSGKRRIVTQNGCSDVCDCKARISYHFAIWQILDRYFQLLGEDAAGSPYLQGRVNSDGKRDATLPKVGGIRI